MSVPVPAFPHWLRPMWLLALLALPLFAWAWTRLRTRRSAWQGLVDPHLLPHLLDTRATRRTRGALWLGLLGYALAVCALAGPSWQRSAQPLWRTRAPLVVALDLSSATLAGDLPPSRLAQARAKIAQLLQARAGGQVALVAYADDAFTVAPLTDDNANVALMLDALSPDIMPVDGSDAGRGIAWSARLLKQAGDAQGDILLLTDHADASARHAAAEAARGGYRVSALGIGVDEGAAYRDRSGVIRHAQLDAGSLRALASAGGGAYVRLEATPRDLDALGVLDPRRGGALSAQGENAVLWQDQGYWLLLPLLPLAALAFRRGGALAVLLLGLCLPWRPAHGADGWWRRPDQQAHARLDQGARAYRRGDFAAAAQAWHDVPGADAAYDLGNALAKAGDYDGAIAAYDRALQQRPGMEDAIVNRDVVRKAMQKKRAQAGADNASKGAQPGTEGKQRDSQARPAQGGKQQAGQRARQQGTRQQAGQQDHRQAGAQPGPQQRGQAASDAQSPQPATPADAQDQRQADAAQRARMQAALRRARAGTQDKPVQRVESAGERERRLADEAWLRRIPDDPGGLLRARFRIEYERRQQQGGTP
ncbi:MAG: VWA domain-containing protein [Lysobacter sp.]|nr:VWA domain-containing protein [Lysobacter sp.]